MVTSVKIKILAEMYDTSIRTIQMFIAEGKIPGASAIKHDKRHAFIFSPELNEKLVNWKERGLDE